jgi:Fe-S oxidoreductase
MQIFAIVVSLTIAVVAIALFVRAIRSIVAVMRIGQPAGRTDRPGRRTLTMLKESLLHTRMLQWHWVGAGHWFVFTGFGLLFFTLVTAFGQLFDADFALPLIGHFFLWEWLTEVVTVVMIVAIVAFIGYRMSRPSERVRGVKGRFFGSTMWQGYFVELVILGVGLCIVTLRGLEYALEDGSAFHYPLTSWLGEAFSGMSDGSVRNAIYLVAMLKIVISFVWMITISVNLTMGVAWHRFLAFFNIWFKRDSSGRTALGAVKPLTSAGKAITLDDIEELDEDSVLGAGSIEDFSWKGILDFSSCTECGRCQSQCPAWNTEKPLSPKLLITALRDHAYAKAPYLQATSDEERASVLAGSDTLQKEVDRPLVGDTGDDWFYLPENGSAVLDPDVLWSCTSCGACVQQCPVDIEHVDHIIDMRRYAVLVESNFPAELNGLFKGLENKGNPWNMSPTARLDWTKGLDFEVKVVGDSIESLDEVDWLFWVGCAGAYEDRAKKTTRAVAELLDLAGVSFGVLGNGETCTGDPARRAGNEFVFQGLAQQNAETFREYKVKKVVSTCAHCFNTLKNEYKDFGVELEVVHHTQLLNRLVREGRLTPVADGEGASKRSITYHDPCYLGRHNGVYTPPRELLQVLPGAEYVEMERNSERSFCCGAGGARMWMEENLGERINVNRTVEAVGTGADQIAVGCPFCRVMLSDGLTAQQAKGEAREEVEVLDVAQMLLASVKGEVATRTRPGAGAARTSKGGAGAPSERPSSPAPSDRQDEATRAEPDSGDDTQTEETVTATEDVGPAAKASGGTSLFDTPTETDSEASPETGPSSSTTVPEHAPAPATSGGSLFDLGDDSPTAPGARTADTGPEASSGAEATEAETRASEVDEPAGKAAAQEAAPVEADLGSGGSLFDLAAPGEDTMPAPTEDATGGETPAASRPPSRSAGLPAGEIPEGGSLFDLEAPEPAAAPDPAEPAATAASQPEAGTSEPEAERGPESQAEAVAAAQPGTPSEASAAPASEIPEGGSLFDLEAPGPAAAPAPAVAPGAAAASESHTTTGADEAPESAPGSASKATPSTSTAVPASTIPDGGSLFDIQAPEPSTTTESASSSKDAAATVSGEPAEDESAHDSSVDESTSEATERTAGAAVTAAATAAAAHAGATDESQPARDQDAEATTGVGETVGAADQPVDVDAPADVAATADETDQPAPDAPTEQPGQASAVEIDEAGSLFDL